MNEFWRHDADMRSERLDTLLTARGIRPFFLVGTLITGLRNRESGVPEYSSPLHFCLHGFGSVPGGQFQPFHRGQFRPPAPRATAGGDEEGSVVKNQSRAVPGLPKGWQGAPDSRSRVQRLDFRVGFRPVALTSHDNEIEVDRD